MTGTGGYIPDAAFRYGQGTSLADDEDGPNPLAQALSNYKPGQLGAAPTIGNAQAQSEYAALVQALSDQQRAESQQGMAGSLMTPEYVPNSGPLGVLAMVAQAAAGRKLDSRAREMGTDAQARVMREMDALTSKREKSKADAEAAKIARNEEILRSGDPYKIAAHGLKMPEANRPEYSLQKVNGRLYYVPTTPQQANTPAADAGFDMLREAVKWQESRGNPNAVSPKGAVGTMQTMPGTLRDPGYGVDPARDNSPQELERVGVDYLRAMTGKYGQVGGLAAYNWGPGNWERALEAAGGDPERALAMAPEETRKYVPSVLQRAQGGSKSPKAQEAQRRRDLWEMQQAGVPLTNGMA